MDNQKHLMIENGAGVPSMVAVIAFLGLWGFIAAEVATFAMTFAH
jgi:hypothetical protein